jgi:hypothetical protein
MNYGHKLKLALCIAATLATTSALAQRGYYPHRDHHPHRDGAAVAAGLVLGSALLWAATRPAPAAYEVPVATTVVSPAPPPASDYWYYCRPAGAYYPYVGSCPVPWEAVPAYRY